MSEAARLVAELRAHVADERVLRAIERVPREAFVIYDGIGLVIPTILAAIYFWRRRREWL